MKKEELNSFNTNPILIRLRPFLESGRRIIDLSRGAAQSKVRGFRIIFVFDDGTKKWIWLKCPLVKFKGIFEGARCLVIAKSERQLQR